MTQPDLHEEQQAADATAVSDWISRQARPLNVADVDGPLADLEPLREVIGDATVVALGRPTHGAHELSVLSHRMLRFLVERLGFRALALEQDPATGARIDDHLRTGNGDPRRLLDGALPHHRNEEMMGVIAWMRSVNVNVGDPADSLRFVGVDTGPDEDDARLSGGMGYVERRLAENVISWRQRTGHKIVYWGGFTHTAVGEARQVSFPPNPPATHRNAGSYLRKQLGTDYVSLGLTFHHGSVDPGSGPLVIPPPPPGLAEAAFGGVGPDAYLLHLQTDQTDPTDHADGTDRSGLSGWKDSPGEPDRRDAVGAWLEAPVTLRLVGGPQYDPRQHAETHVTGGSLTDWFDAIVHVRRVTPVRPLSTRWPTG